MLEESKAPLHPAEVVFSSQRQAENSWNWPCGIRAWPILRCVVIGCLLALLVTLPLAAREIVIQHFDEQVVISLDGTIEVREAIEAQFIGSNWHGIYRYFSNRSASRTTPANRSSTSKAGKDATQNSKSMCRIRIMRRARSFFVIACSMR